MNQQLSDINPLILTYWCTLKQARGLLLEKVMNGSFTRKLNTLSEFAYKTAAKLMARGTQVRQNAHYYDNSVSLHCSGINLVI